MDMRILIWPSQPAIQCVILMGESLAVLLSNSSDVFFFPRTSTPSSPPSFCLLRQWRQSMMEQFFIGVNNRTNHESVWWWTPVDRWIVRFNSARPTIEKLLNYICRSIYITSKTILSLCLNTWVSLKQILRKRRRSWRRITSLASQITQPES